MLDRLQALLAEIYRLDVDYRVDDFLVTDPRIVSLLDADGRSVEEKLLISESDGEAEVSLYLAAALVERLAAHDPLIRLDERNLADFWTALEGVSHFAYFARNATLEKPVRLLEMELQAEVDKYIATAVVIRRQGDRPPPGLHQWLFEWPRFDAQLDDGELDRYRQANRYAGKYCLKLAPEIADGVLDEPLRQELHHFYRLSQPSKIQHIETR